MAFGGPGRTRALVRADVLDVSRVRPRHPHRWRTFPRRDDFTIDADRGGGGRSRDRRPDVVFIASPNNPTGTAVALDTMRAICRRRHRGRGRRRGLLRVRPDRHAERAGAAAGVTPAGGHPDHVQGVRVRRRPARLPGRVAGVRRRPADRPAALPPVGGHPGGRPGGPGHTPARCWPRSTSCGPTGTTWPPGWPTAGSRSPTPTPTSCCSAGSPTGTAVWQALLDRGVLIRETSARRAGCGCRPAPPEEMAAFKAALTDVLGRPRKETAVSAERSRTAHARADRRRSRASRSASTWTAPASPRSAPASASTTTC